MPKALPQFIYGTAWKGDQSASLVTTALRAGFRAIDTAAQPKHYQEHLVGFGIRSFLSSTSMPRSSLYIQTKYTTPSGQDPHNLPYDPSTSIPTQIHASVRSSLHNLRHSDTEPAYLDALLLHSPLPSLAQTLEAWTTLSSYVLVQIRSLGISNVSLPVLSALYSAAEIKPAVVQNRFYAASAYDVKLRQFCREKGIEYQSFWTLTGNPGLLRSQVVRELAGRVGASAESALYALVMGLGVRVLNGTRSHVEEDLKGLEKVEKWKEGKGEEWGRFLKAFRRLIGEE